MSLMVLYQTSSDLSFGGRGRTAALCLRKTWLQSQVGILIEVNLFVQKSYILYSELNFHKKILFGLQIGA